MTTQDTDSSYEAVLSDLKRRREALDATIQALEQIMRGEGAPLLDGTPLSPTPSASESKIRSDSFFNMKIPDAAKKYLRMKKKPQSAREITDALKEGGMITSAKNFYSTVYTALRRLKNSDEVVQLENKEWALAAWYPNRPKNASQKKGEVDQGETEAKEESDVDEDSSEDDEGELKAV